MDLKPIKRVPGDEGARHLTDAEVRRKLNELIDLANGQLEEIVYLRGRGPFAQSSTSGRQAAMIETLERTYRAYVVLPALF
jgi:hypothetical protein